MKYQDEYRDPAAAQQLRQAIQRVTSRAWTIMEICGGQTHTIVKYGIDELLTLRIMTLTEEEKSMAGATDDRTRRLMERTESLAREQLAGLHGAVRSFAPIADDLAGNPWNAREQSPAIESIRVDDVELRPGDRVRLCPGMAGDIFDLALSGTTATIESIQQDYEDQFHVAVTLDDDPGRDLGQARQPGHRFFFKPEELAPLKEPGAGT